MVAMANSNNFYLRIQRNVFTFYDLIKAIITFIQLVIPGRERERSHNPGDFEWSEHTDPPTRPGGPHLGAPVAEGRTNISYELYLGANPIARVEQGAFDGVPALTDAATRALIEAVSPHAASRSSRTPALVRPPVRRRLRWAGNDPSLLSTSCHRANLALERRAQTPGAWRAGPPRLPPAGWPSIFWRERACAPPGGGGHFQ